MKFDAVFELANGGWPMFLVNTAHEIVLANSSAAHFFGAALEEGPLPLPTIWSSTNSLTPAQFLAELEQSQSPAVPLKFRVQSDSTVTFLTSVCPFKSGDEKYFIFQLFPEGPQESKNQTGEANLAQKQKLDCALQLARTVSLDFNNALTIILGHTSLVLSKMEANHPWRQSLLEVEKSAEKAAEIANDLSTFSRQEKETRGQAAGNLNSILQRSVEVFQSSPAIKIQWLLQYERKLFAARFDEAKMQQAFVKILENAVQSLAANGRIIVQSRNIEVSEPTQDRNVRLAAGTYVCAEINDNGCGIEPDVLLRIFEPFFTTKRNHRGLGLAWVYGIVTNHGGGVAVSSQPGTGTSVRVYLPAEKRIVRDSHVTHENLNGTQTILMVDDEDLLLTMGETILSEYGYRVLTANSGRKALEILSKGDAAVDLLITDLVMPGMSGRELADHVHRVSSATRILCTSGFVRPSNPSEDAIYLQKPFTSQDLLLKVKQVLTRGETTLVD